MNAITQARKYLFGRTANEIAGLANRGAVDCAEPEEAFEARTLTLQNIRIGQAFVLAGLVVVGFLVCAPLHAGVALAAAAAQSGALGKLALATGTILMGGRLAGSLYEITAINRQLRTAEPQL